MDDDRITIVLFLLVLVIAAVAIFGGVFTSTTKAQHIAQTQLSPQAEVAGKTIFFVGMRGCDRYDSAMFRVKPYTGVNGQIVDNAIICAGWPFKGYTVRFK